MGRLGAIVLRGGLSRRMGRPKDRLRLGDESLLERVARQLSRPTDPIVVVSAIDQDPPLLSCPVILAHDAVPGRGPLEGLAAGLRALPEDVELAYATSVDAPFLVAAVIERLTDRLGDHDLAIPFARGRYHPLSAVYRVATSLPAVESLLGAGRFRMSAVVDSLRTRVVGEAELRVLDPELVTLRNINTPEDYALAARELPSVPDTF